MKLKQLALSILAIAALTSGCKPAAEPTGTETRETGLPSTTKTQQAAEETAQAWKDYTYARKAELVVRMQSQLTELERDLDQLSAMTDKASATAKTEAQPKIKALRDQVAVLTKNLEAVKGSTESTWDDVKSAFQKGYDEVKVQFQQARQWLSDTIAP